MGYAPPGIQFAPQPTAAVHILDYIGQHPTIEDREISGAESLFKAVPSVPKSQDYIVIFHCEPAPGRWGDDVLRETEMLFRKARLVFGFLSPEWLTTFRHFDFSKINYYQTPWGFDPKVFHPVKMKKRFVCLMTGYVAEAEYLEAVYWAARQVGGEVIHIGGPVGLDRRPGYMRYEGVGDRQMREFYSESYYVNAIREPYGFELPGIEGAACGAQPIYLDLPCYRYWFSDIGLFVDPGEVWDGLKRIFEMGIRREGLTEKVKGFEWGKIASRIWRKILESAARF